VKDGIYLFDFVGIILIAKD